ncbi:MAG: hypothetical protein WCA23_21210 [Stellaceae bacterium]
MRQKEIQPRLEWWKFRSIYQISRRSLQDSNGDGVGDIPGLFPD